ncbi:MAG: acetyl-CoA carboxylase biotin carboxylase subunit [Terrimesophilobacter sp.]
MPINVSAVFGTVLVANRGEIACRVIRTLRELGIRSVAVYSDADRGAKHVSDADSAMRIGPAPAQESYLNIPAIIAAATESGAKAIHPGYGFLSENAEFARACEAAGIVFVGPGTQALALMGDKIRAKNHVESAGVPVIQGVSSPGMSNAELEAAAETLGFPILIKPSAGGGGKGMEPVYERSGLAEGIATARRVARSAFGDDTLLLERLVSAPRHIEVQLLADTHGNVIHLGERECSLQRRHQKVIEEAPSPLLSEQTRARIGEAACTVARSVGYVGAGTVEFLVSDDSPDEFYFMEMNTRLQVEHPVTELVTGLDLVAWQLRIAAGEVLTVTQDDVVLRGHAVEARVYAEDPESGFLPSTGTILELREATGEGVRVDSSLMSGMVISPNYDPMLAKVIAWGHTRNEALARLDSALTQTTILGVRTNLEYLRALISDPDVQAGRLETTLIERKLPELDFRHPDVELLCTAALALSTGILSNTATLPSDAWFSAKGWRMGGVRAPRTYRFATSSTQRADVIVDGESMRIDGSSFIVRLVKNVNHVVESEIDGVITSWSFARDGDTLWLGRNGFSWPLGIVCTEARLRENLAAIERESHPTSPEVRSPMPGTVVAVAVTNGDRVEAGETLLTVEAMKMEHKLTAPVAGVVAITARAGDLVKLNELLARIEPLEVTP